MGIDTIPKGGDSGVGMALSFNSKLVQYEWVEEDKKWVRFYPHDPEPPQDLPDGKYDGEIIDCERPED